MKRITVLLALWCTFALQMNYASKPATIDFYAGSLKDARLKATEENKFIFVDFYAKWCAPCKWMEQTTFQDESVVATLNNHFVSMKIDIDEFDGFSLKQQYDVRYLPTILIFDNKGQLVGRFEETLSPLKLKNLLEEQLKGNSTSLVTRGQQNTSPKQLDTPQLSETVKKTYKVQVGSFSDFKNTFTLVNRLKNEFLEPVIVLNDYVNDRMMYRVLIGSFETKNEAKSFIGILKKDHSIDGILY